MRYEPTIWGGQALLTSTSNAKSWVTCLKKRENGSEFHTAAAAYRVFEIPGSHPVATHRTVAEIRLTHFHGRFSDSKLLLKLPFETILGK